MNSLPPLQPMRREEDQGFLLIDPATRRNLELIETKKEQLNAVVHVYRDLGGGWK